MYRRAGYGSRPHSTVRSHDRGNPREYFALNCQGANKHNSYRFPDRGQPSGQDLVSSLNRPGGNLTGVDRAREDELGPKAGDSCFERGSSDRDNSGFLGQTH